MPTNALRSNDDHSLVRRAAAGDPAAARLIDQRYRRRLTRYARSLLGRSEHDAEDVVQDVLVRAHAELTAGRGPDELRPWLYRLTRNRAIDEMRRARWGEESLDARDEARENADGAETATTVPDALRDRRQEPEAVRRRKESLRDLVSDLADLPVSQRAALLAREVDGDSSATVAERLGVSTAAAQMLVVRARANLVRARDARALDLRLKLLAPPSGIFAAIGLGPVVSGKLLALVGAATVTTGVAVTAGVVVQSRGIDVVSIATARGGDPSPLSNVITPGTGPIKRGDPLPPGISFVTAKVRVPVGQKLPPSGRTLTLRCPSDQRFAALLTTGSRYLQSGYGLRPFPEEGVSREATFHVGKPLRPGARGTLGIECRHLDDPAALARRVSAFGPAPAGTVPRLRRPMILERVAIGRADSPAKRGQLFITIRLTGPAARGADGWDLYADRGDGDVHHLYDADFSEPGAHCYTVMPVRPILHWRRGLTTRVRLWIGDGHGHARLVERTLRVPRPRNPAEPFLDRTDSATGRLGCFSPHM